MIHSDLAKKLLTKLTSSSGDYADIFCERTRQTNIQFQGKKLVNCTPGIVEGSSLRIIKGTEIAHGYTNDHDKKTLIKLSENLARNFDGGSVISNIRAFEQSNMRVLEQEISTKYKIDICQKASDFAWALDNRIKQVSIRFDDLTRETLIYNSYNEHISNAKKLLFFVVHITVGEGKGIFSAHDVLAAQEDYLFFTQEKLHALVNKTANRALLNFKAQEITGGKMTVVMSSSAGGTIIHEAIGHSLEGDLVVKGLSQFANKIGTPVANPIVTVIDDATLKEKRGSYLYDDEGVPGQKTILIENGRLKTYLTDRMSAKQLGVPLSGNGRRESYEYRPITRMSNTYLQSGKDAPDQIIASVDNGLFVKKMGGGQVNTVNGDFVFHIQEANRIKKGKLAEPVRNVTISGNGPQVLHNIDMVGSDLDFAPGNCGKDCQLSPITHAIPTIRVKDLLVGGKG